MKITSCNDFTSLAVKKLSCVHNIIVRDTALLYMHTSHVGDSNDNSENNRHYALYM